MDGQRLLCSLPISEQRLKITSFWRSGSQSGKLSSDLVTTEFMMFHLQMYLQSLYPTLRNNFSPSVANRLTSSTRMMNYCMPRCSKQPLKWNIKYKQSVRETIYLPKVQNHNTKYNHTIVNGIRGWPEGYLPIKCWPPIVTINFTILHTQQKHINKKEEKGKRKKKKKEKGKERKTKKREKYIIYSWHV